jgi:PrsW family intramembrane metalloprotease
VTTCPNCGLETPAQNFCVRCGHRLADDAPPQPERAASQQAGDEASKEPVQPKDRFTAAPHEHRLLPAIASTLFPHLPRADMRHYRVAMAVGTLIVVGLGIAGLFPLALAGAALLVPLVAALYLHDVDIYEDEPVLVIAFTLAWGAASGVVIALLAHTLAPTGIDQVASGHQASPLITVVLLPVLELVLAVAGPALFLLPHRRFNDVLDGVTFGAATAAALSATEVIVIGYKLFEHGLAPGGAVVPWIWRLLTVRLALPILAMAATGAACGALWLRYRAPERDRNALGLLGHPIPALILRALLLVAAAAGQRWLPVGAWFATLLVLDAIALVWLRLMLQLGLREEAAERDIGPDVTCSNCGQPTPRHTFCANCGVALRALPKRRGQPSTAAEPHPSPTRLVTATRVLGFTAFIAALAAALVAIRLLEPAKAQPRCAGTTQCGQPPQLPAPLQNETVWRSTAFGFQLEYPAAQWRVRREGSAGVELTSLVAPVDLLIRGTGPQAPSALVNAEVSDLRGNVLGLASDPATSNRILGPAVGYRYGAGGAYVGAIDSPQGVQDQALLTVTAASNNQLGIVVTTFTTETRASLRRQIYGLADSVINSVTWPGQG